MAMGISGRVEGRTRSLAEKRSRCRKARYLENTITVNIKSLRTMTGVTVEEFAMS